MTTTHPAWPSNDPQTTFQYLCLEGFSVHRCSSYYCMHAQAHVPASFRVTNIPWSGRINSVNTYITNTCGTYNILVIIIIIVYTCVLTDYTCPAYCTCKYRRPVSLYTIAVENPSFLKCDCGVQTDKPWGQNVQKLCANMSSMSLCTYPSFMWQ